MNINDMYEFEKVQCELCGGFGHIKVSPVYKEYKDFDAECPECDGYGHHTVQVLNKETRELLNLVESFREKIENTKNTVSKEKCGNCEGTGRVNFDGCNAQSYCLSCDGKGYLE